VVDHQVGDDPDAPVMRRLGQRLEVGHGADRGMDVAELGDVVAVVFQGRGVDRRQPEAVDTQLLEGVELRGQTEKVAIAVAAGIEESPHIDLVEDGVLIPEAFSTWHEDGPVGGCYRSGERRRTTFSAISRGQPGAGSSRWA